MTKKAKKVNYVQLEPAAFLSDDDFQMMSDAERGIYCTIIFYMFCNNGRIKNDSKAIKRLCNVTSNFEQKWKSVIPKLYQKGDWLRHRRVDSELKQANERLQTSIKAGLKGAEKRWGSHSPPNDPPSTKVNKGKVNKDIYKRQFDIFRKYYPGEKRGLDTEFDYFCKHKDWKEVLSLLLPAVKSEQSRRALAASANQFVPNWKHLKTWLYNRCWEVTTGQTVTAEQTAESEQQALEKKQEEMRREYGPVYRDKTTDQIKELYKTQITHRWLIDEILKERKQ